MQAEAIPVAAADGKTPKGGNRKPYAVGASVAFVALLVGALFVGGSILGEESSSDPSEQYGRVDDAVSASEASYAEGKIRQDGDASDIEAIAREFANAWYNDWAFEDGEMIFNQTPISERCLPYIAEGTELYSEFSDEMNFYAGSGSWLSRGAALSVAAIETTLGDGNTCTVDVAFYGAQNTITQEMFDRIKDRPANRNAWTLTFDGNGKIIALENDVTAAGGVEGGAE